MTRKAVGPHGKANVTRQGRVNVRRALSQNLLRDRHDIEVFLAALPPPDGKPGVEVGAGDGVLTVHLARHFGELTAWELDPAMARRLTAKVRSMPEVRVKVGDFLKSTAPDTAFHLAGNIPFGITNDIVNWSLAAEALQSATLITQWEYARKRTGDYGRWSLKTVTSWPSFDWRLCGRIPRTSFRPVPSIDAGVLVLSRRSESLLPQWALSRWAQVVACGFSGVGGSLFTSLRALYPAKPLRATFREVGLDERQIVAFVHPDQWVTLFQLLELI
jgi:23S rRNA (adenine-N6)-dimethyltransferase